MKHILKLIPIYLFSIPQLVGAACAGSCWEASPIIDDSYFLIKEVIVLPIHITLFIAIILFLLLVFATYKKKQNVAIFLTLLILSMILLFPEDVFFVYAIPYFFLVSLSIVFIAYKNNWRKYLAFLSFIISYILLQLLFSLDYEFSSVRALSLFDDSALSIRQYIPFVIIYFGGILTFMHFIFLQKDKNYTKKYSDLIIFILGVYIWASLSFYYNNYIYSLFLLCIGCLIACGGVGIWKHLHSKSLLLLHVGAGFLISMLVFIKSILFLGDSGVVSILIIFIVPVVTVYIPLAIITKKLYGSYKNFRYIFATTTGCIFTFFIGAGLFTGGLPLIIITSVLIIPPVLVIALIHWFRKRINY